MAYVIPLLKATAGVVSGPEPLLGSQVIGIRGLALVGSALDAVVYISQDAASFVNAQMIAHLRAVAGGLDPGPTLVPYGIGVSQGSYLLVDFVTAGGEVDVYVQ